MPAPVVLKTDKHTSRATKHQLANTIVWHKLINPYCVDEPGERYLKRCGANAFSDKKSKQVAYTVIYEEIGHLRNEIRALEQRIEQHKSSITAWKSQHNSLSSCSKLPGEVHIEIWKYLAHDASNPTTSWVRITHVCSQWRRLALEAQVLWTWPCIRRPHIAEKMLERAGNMKLALVLNQQTVSSLHQAPDKATCMKNLAITVFSRADILIVNFAGIVGSGTAYLAYFLPGDLAIPKISTNLKYIEIDYPQVTPHHHQQSNDHNILKLIQYSINLKYLSLCGTSLFDPQNRAIFARNLGPGFTGTHRSIRVLKVSSTQGPYAHAFSVRAIINTLLYLPFLTTLTLENIFTPLSDEELKWYTTPGPHQPIHYPHLRHICLEGGARPIGVFLEFTYYSPQSFVRLKCFQKETSNPGGLDYERAITKVFQVATQRVYPFIRRLSCVPFHTQWKMHFCHYQGKIRTASLDLFVEPVPKLLSRLPQLCPLLDLQQLIYRLSFSDVDTWKWFGILPELHSLTVEPSIHVAFERVYALFRHPSDSVFDSTLLPSDQPAHAYREMCGTPIFYFPKMRTLIYNQDKLRSGEEISRIWNARQSWLRYYYPDRKLGAPKAQHYLDASSADRLRRWEPTSRT